MPPQTLSGEKTIAIKTIQSIGDDYYEFGMCILDDPDGTRVESIKIQYHDNTKSILMEILRQWKEGAGLEGTWCSVLMCLCHTEQKNLAASLHFALKRIGKNH